MDRIIMHCDLDCFYASVEARDNPDYRGKPLIIGADPKKGNGRGVISTCSYEARKFGLHSAMPISRAFKLCPNGIYLRPNGKKYQSVSEEVMLILKEYSDFFQQGGIDEAYLDITETCLDFKEARIIANEIRKRVFEKVGVTISIGIASTKSIAKIASDHKKPNGTTVVPPKYSSKFLENMNITRIPGIGKKTKNYYYKKGIKTIGDILSIPFDKMTKIYGKNGEWVWNVAHGLDDRKVNEFHEDRKSISKERTFFDDTKDFSIIVSKFEDINDKIHDYLKIKDTYYKTITLKIRFEGFETYTRSKTLQFPIRNKSRALKVVLDLYDEFLSSKKAVRLVGVRFSNLIKNIGKKQITLLNFLCAQC